MNDQMLTIPEVASYLKISKSKIYSLVQSRKIPHVKIGKNVRIREKDLQKWIDANCISLTMLGGTEMMFHTFGK